MERRRGQASHSELRSRHDEFLERAIRPPAERVACFDQDGTTWVEQPIYTQVVYCLNRVPDLVKAKPELANEEPFKTVMRGDLAVIAKLPTQLKAGRVKAGRKVYLLVTVAVAKITFRLQSALRALASPAVICRGAVVTGDRSLSFVQLRMVLQLLYNVCGPIEVTVLLGGMGFSAPGQIDEISEQFDADLQRLDTFRGIHAHLVALVVEQCWLRCLVSSGCCVANHMCHLATFCASVVYRGFSPS